MTRNPWKTLDTTQIYRTHWFSVREDRVTRPDGNPGTYSVVTAERTAVGVLPIWEDGSITLVGQYRYPLREYSWEIPEGGGPLDGDPLEAARRELREETGLEARSWHALGVCHTSNCFLDETCHLFLARDFVQGERAPGGDEQLEARRLPLAEALAMAGDGRITDAISIVGLFRLARHLERT